MKNIDVSIVTDPDVRYSKKQKKKLWTNAERSAKTEKGVRGAVTRHGRNRLKLLPILPRWRAIERRVILEFNKELDRGSLIKGRAASVELTARNRAKRRQDVDDSPISTGYPGILSHSIIRHADSSRYRIYYQFSGNGNFPAVAVRRWFPPFFNRGTPFLSPVDRKSCANGCSAISARRRNQMSERWNPPGIGRGR